MPYNGDMNPCILCGTKVKGLGLCENHLRKYRRGTLSLPTGMVLRARKTKTIEERLSKYVDPTGVCWLWTGAIDKAGYGRVRIPGKTVGAHRWIYEELVGKIPAGLDLDHICRVRHCVNPDHLEPTTRAENLRRGAGNGGVLKVRTA